MPPFRPRAARGFLLPLLALLLGGCGDDPVGANDEIAFLVGDWRATSFVVSNAADPGTAPDLIDLGASFTWNVQPSGQYTAILTFNQVPSVEIGEVSLEGDHLMLTVLTPCCRSDRASYAVSGNVLTLEGETSFDFNLDGEPEEAAAVITLRR